MQRYMQDAHIICFLNQHKLACKCIGAYVALGTCTSLYLYMYMVNVYVTYVCVCVWVSGVDCG